MATETQALRKSGSTLKVSSGWFAAGVSFQRALTVLSDGAFKLFAYVSLEADRRTGRYEATQTDLARVLGKSRRIIGKYIAELERKGICSISSGRNQYARNIFEILDDYWPYNRPSIIEEADGKERGRIRRCGPRQLLGDWLYRWEFRGRGCKNRQDFGEAWGVTWRIARCIVFGCLPEICFVVKWGLA